MKYLALSALALYATLVVAGCTKPVAPSDMAAVENDLVAADLLADAYELLPVCFAHAVTSACKDQKTVNLIEAYRTRAHDAFRALQSATADGAPAAIALAQAALDDYMRNMVPAPKGN